MSELCDGEDGDDADRCVSVLLSVYGLRQDAAAQAGRLLRVLLLRLGALSARPGGPVRQYAVVLLWLSTRSPVLSEGAAARLRSQRVHSMATNSSQLAPLQPEPPAVGIAPVMSSRSILWNDSALLNSCDWQ